MGTKRKFWCWPTEDAVPWLFKYPRPGSGEHWAEKVVAELANSLCVPHAVVELASASGMPGSISQSFAHGERVLVHGNELLATVMDYDLKKVRGQSDHSLDNIFRALETAFGTPSARENNKRQFAGYLVLDALIGNTDRHHENWGLVTKRTATGLHISLAPTFDHASSLGRELSDTVRARRLREDSVAQYSRRARGHVFWTGSDRYGPNPLALVRLATATFPELFREHLARVRDRRSEFQSVVRRVPDDWMSPIAKDFTVAILDYNANELEQCLK